MSQPKAVVIGYGFAGKAFHSYLIGLDTGLTLHGIASRNAETRRRIEAERGCRAYESFEQVLADPEVDLVVLATPNSTHCDLACRALEAGKHVVTDKIMATSLAECDRMIETAERTGKLLTVFQNRRWDGDFLTLNRLLEAGRLGDLRWLEMAWQGFGAWRGWRGQRAQGGGRLFDLGAHMVDQVMLLFPEAVATVYCRMHYDYDEASVDVESHAMLVITFQSGRTAVVDTSGLNALPKPRILASGTAGAYRIHGVDPQEQAMKEERIDEAEESPERGGVFSDGKTQEPVPTENGRWRNFYENVAAVLAGEAEPAVTLEEVRRCMAVFEAALQSAESAQVVRPAIPALSR
jgi:scyllo-inositol 2-dehydrogenase (NADP+)